MQLTELAWERTTFTKNAGDKTTAHVCRFSLISTHYEYRLWWYPPNTKREYDTYSLWKSYPGRDGSNVPIFRVEGELLAQCILYEVTSDVSTEDVRVRGSSPSSIEGPARVSVETSITRHNDRARQNNRNGGRRTERGLPRLAHSSIYLYIAGVWGRLAAWVHKHKVEYR